jgi:IS5 family transposase
MSAIIFRGTTSSDNKFDWYIAEKPRENKKAIRLEYMKPSKRVFVEPAPFRIIKYQFGFKKARYRGLENNDNQSAVSFALSNMVKLTQLIKA